jgi:predicted Rossmann fold flavoprotein
MVGYGKHAYMKVSKFDIVVIGAGAAGMMCASIAGQRGLRVLLLDHAKAPGEKIRISGGGRCNFTNLHCGPQNFLSQNPHFCKSALAGYGPQDFLELLQQYGIAWHEKTLGQLFCDGRADQIVELLLSECEQGQVAQSLNTQIKSVSRDEEGFWVQTSHGEVQAPSLVVACGGASIPKMGASGFGYELARQFGLAMIEPEPALVPFTLPMVFDRPVSELAGISLPVQISLGKTRFHEAMLFTHRGLSGPAILQISSYWSPGQMLEADLLPGIDVQARFKTAKSDAPRQTLSGFLKPLLPKRLAHFLAEQFQNKKLADISNQTWQELEGTLKRWSISPTGTQGFRIAEVTRGGVDTRELSSKTMMANSVPGLYFIGEVVDVTGHLGGHNFQWAWASAVACGRAL